MSGECLLHVVSNMRHFRHNLYSPGHHLKKTKQTLLFSCTKKKKKNHNQTCAKLVTETKVHAQLQLYYFAFIRLYHLLHYCWMCQSHQHKGLSFRNRVSLFSHQHNKDFLLFCTSYMACLEICMQVKHKYSCPQLVKTLEDASHIFKLLIRLIADKFHFHYPVAPTNDW